VSIPLSAFLPYSGETAAEKKASYELSELRMDLSTVENSIKLGIETALLRIEEEEAKIRSSDKAVELASILYGSASERFANGFLTRIELKDAQVRLNTARLGYLSSIYQQKLAVFDLMDAVGVYEF
jgi:outer membrane protein TolC